MALHGELKVNGDVIGTWSARRLARVPEEVNEYECYVQMVGADAREFHVEHRFADGAEALAAKVLAEAAWLKQETV